MPFRGLIPLPEKPKHSPKKKTPKTPSEHKKVEKGIQDRARDTIYPGFNPSRPIGGRNQFRKTYPNNLECSAFLVERTENMPGCKVSCTISIDDKSYRFRIFLDLGGRIIAIQKYDGHGANYLYSGGSPIRSFQFFVSVGFIRERDVSHLDSFMKDLFQITNQSTPLRG